MTAQLRSELLKLRTTRTTRSILVAAAALTLFGVFVEASSASAAELAEVDRQRTILGAGSAAVFFATIAGLLAVTSEFRYGTIQQTLAFEPHRRVVLAAKLAVGALAGLAFGVACVGVSVAAGLAVLVEHDVDLALTNGELLALAAGAVAAAMVGGLFGIAIGTLIRNQVGSIVALVAYAFLVDAGLFRAAPSVGRFLPGKAGDALAGLPDEQLLAPGVGGVVVVLWALAFIVAALVRSERSDV